MIGMVGTRFTSEAVVQLFKHLKVTVVFRRERANVPTLPLGIITIVTISAVATDSNYLILAQPQNPLNEI